LLDRALAGEDVAITRRGKLIARIVPEQGAQAALDRPKCATDVDWIRRHRVTPAVEMDAGELLRELRDSYRY
ncbi:MAG: type II toxin-antitoxin system Phd/YefM family antitoxin, partial [Caulobacteraceae bacterium]